MGIDLKDLKNFQQVFKAEQRRVARARRWEVYKEILMILFLILFMVSLVINIVFAIFLFQMGQYR